MSVHAIPADFEADHSTVEATIKAAQDSPMLAENVTAPGGVAPVETADEHKAEHAAPDVEVPSVAPVETAAQ